jgi:hypothetical protein
MPQEAGIRSLFQLAVLDRLARLRPGNKRKK